MNKSVLKKFAIESRQELMQKIKNKMDSLYVKEDFNKEQKGELYILSNENHSLSLTYEKYQKRELLIKRIKELSLEQVIEEAAYTWFNRIIAIRYMEINDMLPLAKDNQSLGIRVLSSKDNTPDPEILKFTNLTNPDLDINFRKEKYAELKDDNEKFKYVLLLVCKKLGRVIPQVFDGVTDYIDILIPDNLFNDSGFVTKVVNEVPEDNYNQVEIIGWLYQYYNQAEKDRVISAKKVYQKNEIPYATQLFTPDWIVRYMVENSLGRYWIEHSENDSIANNWKYFIKDNIEKSNEKLNPTEITFIDPCCGSGHILVYAFEVFYQIYFQTGYNKNDIPELILKNNLYGLDIDDRAGQLSILSVLLKAREYDRNIFNKDIIRNLHIMSIQESNTISEFTIDNICEENLKEQAKYLIDNFKNAKEIGSLLILESNDYSDLEKNIYNDTTVFGIELKEKLLPIIKIANILSQKYDIVVTNPPYLNNSVMSQNLKKYIKCYYKEEKKDLFGCFINKNVEYSKNNGYVGMLTGNVWMFNSSFKELRDKLMIKSSIDSLLYLAKGSFFEIATIDVCSFVLKKNIKNFGKCFKLEKSNDLMGQEKSFLNKKNNEDYFLLDKSKIMKIPGHPYAFWLSDKIISLFSNNLCIKNISYPKQGLHTGDNMKYIRLWYEVNNKKIMFEEQDKWDEQYKWAMLNKGGEFRKWYGNRNYIINWENNGSEIKNNGQSVGAHNNTFFKDMIGFTDFTSYKPSFRYYGKGFVYDVSGPSIFNNDANINNNYLLCFLNSVIVEEFMNILSPTVHMNQTSLGNIPLIYEEKYKEQLSDLCMSNINISKNDWDSFETSWNFKRHPLISGYNKEYPYSIKKIKDEKNGVVLTKVSGTLEQSYAKWKKQCDENFKKLKQNEEELNKKFIDIYGLQDELTPEEDDKDVTIRKADQVREIKSLISYAVGCMFGRYSLDKEGLIYAGGDFDEIYRKCKKEAGGWAGVSLANYRVLNDNGEEIDLSFEVDNDNIILITDEAYFKDDIVERFKEFISVVYGKETLNENLDFIAETLGKKGTETSEDTIRRYFVNDFFNDHVKTYQKRPIYWLFDSGKKNGFKALIYMHRYNENLVPKIRLDYLHRMQAAYEKMLDDINYKLTTELSMTDKKEAQKRQANLNAKLQEIKEYDEKIANVANQRIKIDLDDGVKVNYEKISFENPETHKIESVLAKIK